MSKPTVEQVIKALDDMSAYASFSEADPDVEAWAFPMVEAEEVLRPLFERETVRTAEELDALPVGSVVTVAYLAYIKKARRVWVGARGLSVGSYALASYGSVVVRFNPGEVRR